MFSVGYQTHAPDQSLCLDQHNSGTVACQLTRNLEVSLFVDEQVLWLQITVEDTMSVTVV